MIQNAVIFCEGDMIDEEQVQLAAGVDLGPDKSMAAKKSYHLRDLDRDRLLEVVRQYRGVVSDIARELGVSRQACYDNFAKFDIDVKAFRKSISVK